MIHFFVALFYYGCSITWLAMGIIGLIEGELTISVGLLLFSLICMFISYGKDEWRKGKNRVNK